MATSTDRQSVEKIRAFFEEFKFLKGIVLSRKCLFWQKFLSVDDVHSLHVSRLDMYTIENSWRSERYFLFSTDDDWFGGSYEIDRSSKKKTLKQMLLNADLLEVGYVVKLEPAEGGRFSVTVFKRPKNFNLNDLPHLVTEAVRAREAQEEVRQEIATV